MKFKFSIVMAVYNVELFLREAIDSVIAQDIGFRHVQLILVDDGSKDGSGAICDEYAAKYPDNILALHKENGGVSSARNLGLGYVQGEYVNFLDSDDKLSRNTLRKVYAFFRKYHEETDIVSIPIHFFDGETGEHGLNVKFRQGSRVIDLNEEWKTVQMSISSCFAKAYCFQDLRFDTRLAYAEDGQLIQLILLHRQTLGVVSGVKYWYRRRSVGEASAIQSFAHNKMWYLPCVRYFHRHIINCCMEQLGYIPRFTQHILMSELKWRWVPGTFPEGVLTEDEKEQYRKELTRILDFIDFDIIQTVDRVSPALIIHLLSLKSRGTSILPEYRGMDISNDFPTIIHSLKLTSQYLELDGMQDFSVHLSQMPEISIVANGQNFAAELLPYRDTIFSLDCAIAQKVAFRCRIPIFANCFSVQIHVKYDNCEMKQNRVIYGQLAPITEKCRSSYYYQDGILLRPQINGFLVERVSSAATVGLEARRLWELLRCPDIGAKKAVASRLMVHILRPFAPKNIWLISDEANRADDNGEAFFLYCTQQSRSLCTPIFAISKTSPDYQRMKRHGCVVPYLSWRYKLLHLLATHTISAYSHMELTSPFLDRTHFYNDLLQRNRTVFLQHGIIKDDISNTLNKYVKNYSLFVTSAEREYRSILDGNYGYEPDEVILTGLPRYDRLYNRTQKCITIMPTWRSSLVGAFDPKNTRWKLMPGFENSEFYRFYAALLTSEKLCAHAERLGYTVQFLIHPVLLPYVDHFPRMPHIAVLGAGTNYRDVFAESALILTDYSSVAFDFAYLRKPVVYAQFDENHYEKGYFDYERDGFGEVENNLDDTIDRIIAYMENGCQLKDKYRQRIDGFFAFNDQNNCKRVFDRIVELDTQ